MGPVKGRFRGTEPQYKPALNVLPTNALDDTGCGQKSGPLKFFTFFSATVWNFKLKFYSFIE